MDEEETSRKNGDVLLLYEGKEITPLTLKEFRKDIDEGPEDERKIRTVAFYYDEISQTQWLAAGGDHAIIRLWKLPENGTKWTEETIKFKNNPITEAISQIAFTRDKNNHIRLVATTEEENIYVWEFKSSNDFPTKLTEKPLIPKGGKGGTVAINKNYLATGGRLGTIYLWKLDSLNTSPILLQGHKHNIRVLTFSQPKNDQEELYLASASDDKTIRVWTVETESVKNIVEKRIKEDNLGLTEEEWEDIFGDSISYGDNRV